MNAQTFLRIMCREWPSEIKCRKFLSDPANINAADSVGYTALMNAATYDYKSLAVALLERGANVNHANAYGETVVAKAAARGNIDMVNMLIKAGADVSIPDRKGTPPLAIVLERDIELNISVHPKWQKEMAEILIRAGADPNKAATYDFMSRTAPLLICLKYGWDDTARMLIERGADASVTNSAGDSALILALADSKADLAQLMIERGADINFVTGNGNTPLTIAASRGLSGITSLLLDKGAAINHTNKNGETALLVALEYGSEETAITLIERGADITPSNKNGETALIFALWKGYERASKLLIEKGADIRTVTQNGTTPLILAASVGFEDIVRNMIKRGVDLNHKDYKERSAISFAMDVGHTKIVEMLKKAGAIPPAVKEEQLIKEMEPVKTSSTIDAVGALLYTALPSLNITDISYIQQEYEGFKPIWRSTGLHEASEDELFELIYPNIHNSEFTRGFQFFVVQTFDDNRRASIISFSDGDGASVCVFRTADKYYYFGNYYFL